MHPEAPHPATDLLDLPEEPDVRLSVAATFGIASELEVPAFSRRTEYVPDIDPTYQFDRDTTLAILAGFAHNRRVLIQGYHGTGKSTHIEQVAARLNWPCIRINLDSHISRIDLIGKDAIVLKDGKQITEYREGILPWSLQRPVALAFDEYDAGRPDVMFVIQRVLEAQGRMTLLDQNKVIRPHKAFRLFATANTVGLGDTSGLYHGTQQINQGQMDRWSIVTQLNYLVHGDECRIVLAKCPGYDTDGGPQEDLEHGDAGRPHPQRLHGRRHLHGHVAADGDHLGRERRDLRRPRFRLPGDLPQQVRRGGAPYRGRVLSALLRGRAARNPRPTSPTPEPVASADAVSETIKQNLEELQRALACTLRAVACNGARRGRIPWPRARRCPAAAGTRSRRTPGAAAARPDPA